MSAGLTLTALLRLFQDGKDVLRQLKQAQELECQRPTDDRVMAQGKPLHNTAQVHKQGQLGSKRGRAWWKGANCTQSM
jgi:hypothetical protein